MTFPTTSAPGPAQPGAPGLRLALGRLVRVGMDLLGLLHARWGDQARPLPPRLAAAPARAERQATRALVWVVALGRCLSGDGRFRIAFRFSSPGLDAATRAACGLPPLPARGPLTPAQRARRRDAARLRYIRRVFATQPTGAIATRLARRLGIPREDPRWPTGLAALSDPPALIGRRAAQLRHAARTAAPGHAARTTAPPRPSPGPTRPPAGPAQISPAPD